MTKQTLAIALTLAALPALAREPGGQVTGTLNGQPLNCEIWPMQSDFSAFSGVTTVSITANRCTGVRGIDMVMVGFEKTGDTIGKVEIRLTGAEGKLYGGTGTGSVQVPELLTFSEDDGYLSLAGTVSAPVGPSGDHGNSIDTGAAQPLEISFSGVIEVLGH